MKVLCSQSEITASDAAQKEQKYFSQACLVAKFIKHN